MRERITGMAVAVVAIVVAFAAHVTMHSVRWHQIGQRVVRVLEAGRVRPDTAVRLALDVIALIIACRATDRRACA